MNLDRFLTDPGKLVVITGAGCSTASGIDDYRDASGAWKRAQPIQHQDFMTSLRARKRYWARSQRGFPQFKQASPNGAHFGLAGLEAAGQLVGLITQNVDGLHQRAGHQRVLDLHGCLDEVVCMTCGALIARREIQDWLETHNRKFQDADFRPAPDGDADLHAGVRFEDVQTPACFQCGGILKPNVVFYGDSVPRPIVDLAYQWVDQADRVLVVGTSLMVFSSFRFVRRAHEQGKLIGAINNGKTRADEWLSFKVEANCADVLGAYAG